jgi:mRNA interferase HigB
MHIITKRALREFWENHPESEASLLNWYRLTKKADWNNLAETRRDFPHADQAGVCTIFNIGGNNYRLITKIYYPAKRVLIRFVLTHAEYNKKRYKDDCQC